MTTDKNTYKEEEFGGTLSARPLILNFQPTSFRVLEESEELLRWEQNLATRVGLARTAGLSDILKASRTCCDSSSPSIPASGDNEDVDDCDID